MLQFEFHSESVYRNVSKRRNHRDINSFANVWTQRIPLQFFEYGIGDDDRHPEYRGVQPCRSLSKWRGLPFLPQSFVVVLRVQMNKPVDYLRPSKPTRARRRAIKRLLWRPKMNWRITLRRGLLCSHQ